MQLESDSAWLWSRNSASWHHFAIIGLEFRLYGEVCHSCSFHENFPSSRISGGKMWQNVAKVCKQDRISKAVQCGWPSDGKSEISPCCFSQPATLDAQGLKKHWANVPEQSRYCKTEMKFHGPCNLYTICMAHTCNTEMKHEICWCTLYIDS